MRHRPVKEASQPRARRRVKDIGACCRRSRTARAVDHFFKHGADRLGHIETAGEHETRQQDVGDPTTSTAQSRHEDLVAQTDLAHRSRYPDQNVIGHEHDGQSGRGNSMSRPPSHVGVDGQGAGPYDGHGRYKPALDPSRLQRPNCAGGVPQVQERLILARSSRVGQCKRRQRARPNAAFECSGSQAVNSRTHGEVVPTRMRVVSQNHSFSRYDRASTPGLEQALGAPKPRCPNTCETQRTGPGQQLTLLGTCAVTEARMGVGRRGAMGDFGRGE